MLSSLLRNMGSVKSFLILNTFADLEWHLTKCEVSLLGEDSIDFVGPTREFFYLR